MASRPAPEQVTSAADLRDWYWTRAELDAVARRLGVSRTGNKQAVAERLVARLEGRAEPERTSRRPRPAGPALQVPLSADDVIPDGQRMTRVVREWFVGQIGPSFRFDAHLRRVFADPAGRTLGDAVRIWHETRDESPGPISPQFEYNRFTRWYRATHPEADRAALSAAWQQYKDTPVSRRPELPV